MSDIKQGLAEFETPPGYKESDNERVYIPESCLPAYTLYIKKGHYE